MRPIVELATTMSVTAGQRSPPAETSSAGSSTSSSSPSKARSRPSSSASTSIAVRNPTRPRLTPSTGTRVPRKRRSARSIVPSPPSTIARSAAPRSSPPTSPCLAASSSGSSSSIPRSSATARSRESEWLLVSAWPCVITAARFTSGSGVVDPVFELIGILRPLALDEMQEELAVPLRAGQAGVYDAGHLRPPAGRVRGDLAQHPPPHLVVANHAARRLGAAGLELRLHEHDRVPPGRGERERRRQRLAHADERDVAHDKRRRERQLPRLAHVRPLQHRHARVVAEARVQLPIADVERDHACRTALEQDVGE